jgi:hypothetical protein
MASDNDEGLVERTADKAIELAGWGFPLVRAANAIFPKKLTTKLGRMNASPAGSSASPPAR